MLLATSNTHLSHYAGRALLIALLALSGLSLKAQVPSQNGMVVSDHYLASEIGAAILKKGGNAIDAAVATGFALAVAHPQAGNIGGGGFMIYRPSDGNATAIDFREKAPLLASADMFLNEQGKLIKGSNHFGAKAIGVPGTVAGFFMAHQKYGKLPWSELVQPAILLATNGMPLSPTLAKHAKRFYENAPNNFMQYYFCNQDQALLKSGDLWRQPNLAATLMMIRDHGIAGFYQGPIAQAMVKYLQENGGIISLDDLKQYEAVEREPLRGTFHEYEIIAMPPPSSGGVALVEMMNLMELVNFDTIAFGSAKYLHFLAEAMRRAYADRAQYLGDPDFNEDMPLSKLTSKDFAELRFNNIDFSQASVSDSSLYGQLYDGRNTTHYSVIDKNKNAVSVTYTLEQSYGSMMGSPELGFIFNNEMGDFNPQPGFTNSKGLIGTHPNLIEPEKRMLSSMTPTIITKDEEPYLVIGSPGGRTIINTVFQTVLAVLAYEMAVNEAIEALKIHHQWLPDVLTYEKGRIPKGTRKDLGKMGHQLKARDQLGRLMGIQFDRETQSFIGAADSASPDGAAVGY